MENIDTMLLNLETLKMRDVKQYKVEKLLNSY